MSAILSCDVTAVDLKLSFLVAALSSYKCDSVLHPFPPSCIQSGNVKNFKHLSGVCDLVPDVAGLWRLLEQSPEALSPDVYSLLNWLCTDATFTLRHCTNTHEKFREILSLTKQTGSVAEPPSHIFEIIYTEEQDNKFLSRSPDKDTLHAYHGSRLENFHSILHNGLQQHLNRTSAYGSGIYLSSELDVSLVFSPSGLGWRHSQLSNRLSCVAVCQLIDHPDVKCGIKDGSSGRNRASDSLQGDIPEKYFLVTNNDLVRVRYLLIYADKNNRNVCGVRSSRWAWVREHQFMLMIVCYCALLLVVGLAQSPQVNKYWRRAFR